MDKNMQTPAPSSLHALFESQVDRSPDAVAVTFEEERLTYRQLDQRANQVAHLLKAWGVGPESRVGLCTGRHPEMLVGLLGILKAGGAYVPVEPAYPRQRLAFLLEDAAVSVLLTRRAIEAVLPGHPGRVLRLNESPLLARQPTTRPASPVRPEHLAYVLYTSGSTGMPKGVQVEHRNLLHVAGEVAHTPGLAPGSRILQYASLCFDASVWELLLAWCSGGALHLMAAEDMLPGAGLLRRLGEQAITHAVLPPSVLVALPPAELPDLKVLISAGEACPASVVARWGPGRRLFNGYGPTETTVFVTLHECEDSERPPPIGRPIPGVGAFLFDAELRPVPAGTPGELYIGGEGVTRGYWRRPELTAQRFVPHPETGERLYRTGDLVRSLPGGPLEFLGRVDHQLKIRGNRVEPGEVEAVLARHPAVQAVVVVGREDTPGNRRLVAYLVLQPGGSPGPSGWRQYASEALPEHLIPSAFVELPALPLTPNGKVDRHALPVPGGDRPALASAFRAPVTPLQRTLEALWSQVLEVAPVGLDDDFLELGGDSLRAATLAARIRSVLSVELPPHEVLASPTLARLGERIEALPRSTAAPALVATARRPEELPLSSAQQRLWFLHQLEPRSTAYNLAFLLQLDGPLNEAALARALEALVHRHEVLRTHFPTAGDHPVQRIAPPSPLALPRSDWRQLPATEREERLARFAREELAVAFDLSQGPLLRAQLVCFEDEAHALLLALHHTICDGASMGVLLRELSALYEAFQSSTPPRLGELPIQYSDYALWQRRWLQSEGLTDGLAFWKRALSGAHGVLELPFDRARPAKPTFRGAAHPLWLSTATTRALEALAHEQGATPFMVLLAAVGALLQRCTGSEDVLVGIPVAGRNRTELEGLIGLFVNSLPVRLRLHGAPSFRELLSRVREQLLEAYAHQEVPLEKLVEAVRPRRDPGHPPLFQVMLALQQPPPERVTGEGLRWNLSEMDIGAAPFELTWNLWQSEGRLGGTLIYSTELFDPSTIGQLARDFVALVDEVTARPERSLARLEQPGRWGLPDSARVKELEAALLSLPSVWDCAVRLRRLPGASEPQRVAYVACTDAHALREFRARFQSPQLTPDVIVPLHALPLGPDGYVDEGALQQLEVLDEDVARQWEERMRGLPGVDEVAVGIGPVTKAASERIHLSDVLPGSPARAPRRAENLPTPPRSGHAKPAPPRGEPTARAFSDGGPLVIPPDAPRTLTEALVRTASTAAGRGQTYVEQDGSTHHQSYADLLHEARCMLTGLRAHGLVPGEPVILQLDSLREYCTTLWACLLGGFRPVTVAVAPTYETRHAVVAKLHGAWELLGRPALLASGHLVRPLLGLQRLLSMEGLRVLSTEGLGRHPPAEHLHPARSGDVAFLQLSSGSTGMPKCIQVLHDGIVHHIHAAARVNGYAAEDVFLNWLPFDHVGPLLTYHLRGTYQGHKQVHVATDWILAAPLRWLDLMQAHGVTHSWSPNFGYKLVSDALGNHPERTWKLQKLTCLMNGGEQVTLPVIREFLERVAPFGVRPSILQPAFGMAELCTVVACQSPFDIERGVHRIAKSSLGGRLDTRPDEDSPTVSFVELGLPVPGVQLRIVDANNQLLPEGVIGRFQARGRVVTPGYLGNEAANREAFVGDGWFNTGDSGFLLNGRLTLTGREKELIIVRGSHLYCHEIEDLVRGVEGVEPACIAACGVEDPAHGTGGLAIFFAPLNMDLGTCSRLAAGIRARVTTALGVAPSYVVPVSQTEFPRTTSGKIQRAALKDALEAGRFTQLLKALDLHQGNANTLPHWFHQRVWCPNEAITRLSPRPGACLLFLDASGLGARLRDELRQAGRRCVTVEPGPERGQRDPDTFRLPVGDAAAYAWLLERLARQDVTLTQILHLWCVGDNAAEPSAEARQRGLFSLLYLSQALARLPGDKGPLRLQIVASRAQATASDEPVDCDKALVLGLVQTLPQELPWLDSRHLDLPLEPLEENVRHVLFELEVVQREREVARRLGRRLVPRLVQVDFSARPQRPLPLEAGGVYLITGGLGFIGAELSRRLLSLKGTKLLLLGRSPLSLPHDDGRERTWRELTELAAKSNGEVLYEPVDVSELPGLHHAVSRAEARWGSPLKGAFHLAGVLEERLLLEETPEHLAAVLRPKVEGAWALKQLLAERPGAFFAGFSSVNATFGGFSVGAYSAANRFLEALLHEQRRTGASQAFCFAWSRWEDDAQAGMDTERRLAGARGYQLISASRGWNSLLTGLCHEVGELLVGLDGGNPHIRAHLLRPPLQVNQLHALFTAGAQAVPGEGAPPVDVRDRFGTPVSCALHRVARMLRTPGGAVDFTALLDVEAGPRGNTPERVPPGNAVERQVAAIWRELLGVEEVGAFDNFFELGGHSMLLVQAQSRLEKAFQREVSVLELFRHPTLRSLATYLDGSEPRASEDDVIDERARKQRAARGRQRLRQPLSSRKTEDNT
jgi:amino acid adenylation domain-containing protein